MDPEFVGETPTAQDVDVPKTQQQAEVPTDFHKEFFDKYVESEISRQDQLREKLSTKLSEQEKFRIEKDLFESEKKMFELGVKPRTSLNLVEDVSSLGLDPNSEGYSFLRDAIKETDAEGARQMLAFAKALLGSKAVPIDITPKTQGDRVESTIKGMPTAADFLDPEKKDAAKAALQKMFASMKEGF